MEYWVKWMLGFIIALALAVVVWAAWDSVTAETIEIRKDEWRCVAQHNETHYRPQPVGKVTIMVPYLVEVCDRYDRIK